MTAQERRLAGELFELGLIVFKHVKGQVDGERPGGLSVPQFRLLIALKHKGRASVTELAERSGRAAPTVSEMIDTLVARDLAARGVDPDDRRRVTVSLTAAGQALLEAHRRRVEEVLGEALGELTDDELARAEMVLADLRRRLEAAPRGAGEVAHG